MNSDNKRDVRSTQVISQPPRAVRSNLFMQYSSTDTDTWCGIPFVAIIDTGSPISLMKRELIPDNVKIIKPLDKNCIFSGINGTKLDLLGMFETDISVNNNKIYNMCFYVVPENSMTMSAILGRDFISK